MIQVNKSLILIITIFSFWLYIYLTNIKEEQEQEQNQKDNFADDDIQYTNGIPDISAMRKNNLVISPVNAKGE